VTDVREQVRARYAKAAAAVAGGAQPACCGPAEGTEDTASGACSGPREVFGSALYGAEDETVVPETALLASLGCGNPTAVAELEEGQAVLDLGSGGGIDVLLSAARVGPRGKAYGLDMTEEMLTLANANKAKSGLRNVEFLEGYIEDIPLPADSVDVIISNCVVNLAADKNAVFEEMYRVLKEAGRVGISDVVASSELTPEERATRGSYVGCIAGALSFEEYEAGLTAAGFTGIALSPTHEVADGFWATTIKATKPRAW
jgi:arsenite methyltransferase